MPTSRPTGQRAESELRRAEALRILGASLNSGSLSRATPLLALQRLLVGRQAGKYQMVRSRVSLREFTATSDSTRNMIGLAALLPIRWCLMFRMNRFETSSCNADSLNEIPNI